MTNKNQNGERRTENGNQIAFRSPSSALRPSADGQRDALAADLQTRAYGLQPTTLNLEDRSVEAVLATEAPTVVMGILNGDRAEPYQEVLLMSGCVVPAQLPLLDTHDRSSVSRQIGSIHHLRTENTQLLGRLRLATVAEREWALVREGHVTDVSAGYRRLERTIIPRGATRQVLGRSFTAPPDMPLVIVTRWQPHEASLTPIGADPNSRIRTAGDEPAVVTPQSPPLPSRNRPVNAQLRAHLETLGLRADATLDQAWTFYQGLSGENQVRAAALLGSDTPPTVTPVTTTATVTTPDGTRSETVTVNDPEAIRTLARNAERLRISRIQELAGDETPDELVTRAISEGWDEGRFSAAALQAVRDVRSPSAGGVAIHTRSHDQDCTRSALQAGLMLRNGTPIDRDWSRHRDQARAGQLPAWLSQEINSAQRNQVMDAAWQFRNLSLVDICREAVRIDGGRMTNDSDEMIRTAISGGSLSAIFTTNINAELLGAYVDAADTTRGWVAETDVANFQSHERASMGRFGALTKHARGGEADHLDVDATRETSKIYRYTGQFVLDEQDIIDDRFGALDQVSPQDMGNTAAQLRPDMVYGELITNPSLDADSVQLFHASHVNLGSAVFSASALQDAIATFAKQRLRGRPLNLAPRYVLVPHDLLFAAEIAITSAQRFATTGDANPLNKRGLTIVSDDRLGVGGGTDPRTKTAYTGTATNWFLAARPGENGAKTLVVKYRRGTGRAPQIRSFVLDKGTWGLGWDIVHDIGCDSDDYRGLYKSTGA